MKVLSLITLALLLNTFSLFGQESYSKAISVISDNDFYVNPYQDQYYSNGLLVNYHFLKKNYSEKFIKSIISLNLGHSIYTPSKRYKKITTNQDRPFAAIFFGALAKANFTHQNSIKKWEFQFGVLGPAAQGEVVQNWLHRSFGMSESEGWAYQMNNLLALNINYLYLKHLFSVIDNKIDLSIYFDGSAGTLLTQFDMGFALRVGFIPLNPIFNTIFFGSNLDTSENQEFKKEVFFFLKPRVGYLVYDASISGSLFNNSSPVRYNTIPFQTSLEIGLNVSGRRLDFSYSIFFLSKRPDNAIAKAHEYGRIQLAYRFK